MDNAEHQGLADVYVLLRSDHDRCLQGGRLHKASSANESCPKPCRSPQMYPTWIMRGERYVS